eukprot:Nitzschia sp. Nitz4//scaffold61_size107673//92874//94279//NITZ4_004252-RA/size107673-processed-gene-0.169-mRNA-1//1//CDS//3329555761//5981//frame0
MHAQMPPIKMKASRILSWSACFCLWSTAASLDQAEFLSQIDALQKNSAELDSLDLAATAAQVQAMQREIGDLQAAHGKIEALEADVRSLVAKANGKQIQGLLTRLQTILEKELRLRSLGPHLAQKDVETHVEKAELNKKMFPPVIVEESEAELKSWIFDIVAEEIMAFKNDLTTKLSSRPPSSSSCQSLTDAAQKIQVAFNDYSQDGVGIIDHAQGGTIVYSLTSPTYMPPPSNEELMGNVWWRKYIPEDWEGLLPEGWEEWDVGLPAPIYHTLNLQGGKTLPPEVVLDGKVLPGSCWPMDGSKGQVTVRLPYDIEVESFSIDMVSSDILPEDAWSSAPKRMVVVAYPPCEVDATQECHALGFDVNDPMEVAHFELDADGASIQSFDSIYATMEKAEGDDNDTCDQSCTKPPMRDTAAVTLKIVDNFGSPDFTCIYRFRVHGHRI